MALAQEKMYTEEDYNNLPEGTHAELIDGRIYYHAALNRMHQKILGELFFRINVYIKEKGGSCEVYPAPFDVKLWEDRATIVEPDISVICAPEKLTERGCLGAPDWIIEIVSPGNPGHDYVRKLNLYADAGVREYWIVDPMGEKVYVYRLEEQKLRAEEYSLEDRVGVLIYPDLEIDFSEIAL